MRLSLRRGLRPKQRGSVLVIAILVITAILSLGILSMHSTRSSVDHAGNLRSAHQARAVAELGLYHAMTVMQQRGQSLLQTLRTTPDSTIEIESTGRILVRNADGTEGPSISMDPPDFLEHSPLGSYKAVPSYRVVVDGFHVVPVRAGSEAGELRRSGEIYCHMDFTATGYIDSVALPTAEQWATSTSQDRGAAYILKAAASLGPFVTNGCRRL